MISITRFQTPENLVGYFGTFPNEESSGVDKAGKPLPLGTQHMSRKGSDIVRKYLWNAAKSAVQHWIGGPGGPRPPAENYVQHYIQLSDLRIEISVVDGCSSRQLIARIKWGTATSDLGPVQANSSTVTDGISASFSTTVTGDVDTRCPQNLIILPTGNHQVASFRIVESGSIIRFIRIPLHASNQDSPPENPLSAPTMTLSHSSSISC